MPASRHCYLTVRRLRLTHRRCQFARLPPSQNNLHGAPEMSVYRLSAGCTATYWVPSQSDLDLRCWQGHRRCVQVATTPTAAGRMVQACAQTVSMRLSAHMRALRTYERLQLGRGTPRHRCRVHDVAPARVQAEEHLRAAAARVAGAGAGSLRPPSHFLPRAARQDNRAHRAQGRAQMARTRRRFMRATMQAERPGAPSRRPARR